MNTKAYRLKSELIYHPVPLHVSGLGEIAKYIRNQFKVSYYLSRLLAEYVIELRKQEREKMKRRKRYDL